MISALPEREFLAIDCAILAMGNLVDRFLSLVDFINNIHAVLIEQNHLWINRRFEVASKAIDFDDALDIGPHFATRENLVRLEFNCLADYASVDTLVALEHDSANDGILTDQDR